MADSNEALKFSYAQRLNYKCIHLCGSGCARACVRGFVGFIGFICISVAISLSIYLSNHVSMSIYLYYNSENPTRLFGPRSHLLGFVCSEAVFGSGSSLTA